MPTNRSTTAGALVINGRDDTEYLFAGPMVARCLSGDSTPRFNKAVDALGIPGVTPHTLRHTAGSLAISETPSATGVLLASKLLRHKNESTTANIYSSSKAIGTSWARRWTLQ